MKKHVVVDTLTYFYRVRWEHGEDCSWAYTDFYKQTYEYSYKRWLFFGKTIVKQRPKILFTINEDADSEHLSKDFWLRAIREKIALLNRKEELKKGELI